MVQDAVDRAMALAITAGERGRSTAPPNPWVGCVLLQDGEVIGEGFHERPGAPHAEVAALRAAGDRARGATAVVTLEPCSHHGRTGPCADALLTAGVDRVIVALEDPDERVRGGGIARLRAAGVDVVMGPGAGEAARSLAPYLTHRRTGRAFCVVKTAVSIDGRTTAADGTSQWITGADARADAHRLRAESQAVIVGSGTALADRPALTAREVEPPVERPPLRVLLDARGRVPADGPLFDVAAAPTLVLTTDHAPASRVDDWRAAGAKVETLPAGGDGGVDLAAALDLLGRLQVLQALVEGGASVHGSLIGAGLADRIIAYVGGVVLGPAGRPVFDMPGPATIADAGRWRLTGVEPMGADVRLDYEPLVRDAG